MSADGLAAVVSGVDLALVSWMDGPVVDLSSMNVTTGGRNKNKLDQQRVGRCLCSKETTAAVEPTQDGSTLLKPTLKKAPHYSAAGSATKTLTIDRHIVPQVVEVATHRTKQGQVSRTNSSSEIVSRTGGNKLNRVASNSTRNANVSSTKPILSRKNWNNTIDVSGVGAARQQQHQPSCLRRYGSQQSCKSATTLRSYVANSSTSRGKFYFLFSNGQCRVDGAELDIIDRVLNPLKSAHLRKIKGIESIEVGRARDARISVAPCLPNERKHLNSEK